MYEDLTINNYIQYIEYDYDPTSQVNNYYACGKQPVDRVFINKHSENGGLTWAKTLTTTIATWGATCDGLKTVKPQASYLYMMGTIGVLGSRSLYIMQVKTIDGSILWIKQISTLA